MTDDHEGKMTEEVIQRREGCQYICECPEPVKKLEVKRGKVVATLESGMKFIVPSAPLSRT